MAAYGTANFVFTSKMKKSVLVESRELEGTVYQFRFRKRRMDGTELWCCMGCEETKRSEGTLHPVPSIVMDGNRHISDPHQPFYRHFCAGKRKEDVLAKQVSILEHKWK